MEKEPPVGKRLWVINEHDVAVDYRGWRIWPMTAKMLFQLPTGEIIDHFENELAYFYVSMWPTEVIRISLTM